MINMIYNTVIKGNKQTEISVGNQQSAIFIFSISSEMIVTWFPQNQQFQLLSSIF